VPKKGGNVVDVATGQSYPQTIAADKTGIYWGTYGGGMVRSDPEGSAPVVLGCCFGNALDLAVDGDALYFTGIYDDGKGWLYRWKLGEASAYQMTSIKAYYMALSGPSVIFGAEGIYRIAK
jgi:hypothetical protein